MDNEFKNSFNAEYNQSIKQEKESKNNSSIASVEYMKLYESFTNKIKSIFNGMDCISIHESEVEVNIDDVSFIQKKICITFISKFISFTPSGKDNINQIFRIDVKTNSENPFLDEAIFIQHKNNSNEELQINQEELQMLIAQEHEDDLHKLLYKNYKFILIDEEKLKSFLMQVLL